VLTREMTLQRAPPNDRVRSRKRPKLGARVVGTGHPIAIFLAGCRECLAEWEV
jgi:hypothetical protein